jgi:hypothetical protein
VPGARHDYSSGVLPPRRTPLVAALGVLVLLGFVAAPASAGEVQYRFKTAKHATGPFTQTDKALNVPVGRSKTVYWKVKSAADAKMDLLFDDAVTPNPNPPGFRIRWFRGKTNITPEVKGAGFAFALKPGKAKVLRSVVKHKAPSAAFCLSAGVTDGSSTIFALFHVNNAVCN